MSTSPVEIYKDKHSTPPFALYWKKPDVLDPALVTAKYKRSRLRLLNLKRVRQQENMYVLGNSRF